MTAVGIIPARYPATRFPGKPLAPIAGAPMIERVWRGARGAKSLRDVIVATDLPPDPRGALVAIGREVFAPLRAYPGLWAFWWPRFLRLADWFAGQEVARRGDIRHSHAEVRGELSFAAPGGRFTLTATADRIDQLGDGGLAILDYKTGQAPPAADLAEGFDFSMESSPRTAR